MSQWCRALEVSRSGLYAARQRRRYQKSVYAFSIQPKAAFEASGKSYGSRRLSATLQLEGLAVRRHRARKLMRSNGCGHAGIADYIVGLYNPIRLHSTLEYRSPPQYKQQFLANHRIYKISYRSV